MNIGKVHMRDTIVDRKTRTGAACSSGARWTYNCGSVIVTTVCQPAKVTCRVCLRMIKDRNK